MKPATLKALKGSIKKWERIVDGTGSDEGESNCPLCKRFNNDPLVVCALGNERCPVYLATGLAGCDGTPYRDWRDAMGERFYTFDVGEARERKATDDETVMCAVLELEFLKSLLPRGAK